MAQPPKSDSPQPGAQAQAPPPAQAQQATRSHGRGGAGNINSKPSTALNANDLQTPTIKGTTYTTGRGGSGSKLTEERELHRTEQPKLDNMASANPTNPAESRLAQDVDTPAHHSKDMSGTYHWGRGGEGNMTTIGKDKLSAKEVVKEKVLGRGTSKERPSMGSKERTFSSGSEKPAAERRGSFQAAVNKGKEILGLKKEKNGNGTTTTTAKNGNGENKILEEDEKKEALKERQGSNDESAISD